MGGYGDCQLKRIVLSKSTHFIIVEVPTFVQSPLVAGASACAAAAHSEFGKREGQRILALLHNRVPVLSEVMERAAPPSEEFQHVLTNVCDVLPHGPACSRPTPASANGLGHAAPSCEMQSLRGTRAGGVNPLPRPQMLPRLAATEEFTVVGKKRANKWETAESQRKLALQVWVRQRTHKLRINAATKIQRNFRLRLKCLMATETAAHWKCEDFKQAVRAYTDQLVARSFLRGAGRQAGKSKPASEPDSAGADDDHAILDEAIARADWERSQRVQALAPACHALKRALHRFPGQCLQGHALSNAAVPAGGRCEICRTGVDMQLVATCNEECGFYCLNCVPDPIANVGFALERRCLECHEGVT